MAKIVDRVVVFTQENHTTDNYFTSLRAWGANVATGWPTQPNPPAHDQAHTRASTCSACRPSVCPASTPPRPSPTCLGLVRRIENMVAEIPAYRGEVEHRQDFARTRTEELLAVADAPFEHEAELSDKEHELATLTAQLHLDANSPEAHARAEAARERLAARGRTPGWSLALNPTPAMLAEYGQEELMLRAGRRSGAGAELGSSAGAHASVPAAAAERGDGSARAAPELTAEERAVQEVMAGRRTKTIRQIVDYAANGGGAAARGSGAAQRDRHRDGPARGR